MQVRTSLLFVFVFFGVTSVECSAFVFETPTDFWNTSDTLPKDSYEGRWISQLFLKAQRTFDMHPDVGIECKNDFESYKLHLRNDTAWAIRMYESSEWPSMGIFSGTTTFLGNWNECLFVSMHNIKGQYCLVRGIYNFNNLISDKQTKEPAEWPNDELSVWEIMKMYEYNPVRANRTNLYWAMCVPSSCSNDDLQLSLNSTVYPVFKNNNLDITIEVNPSHCDVQRTTEYSFGFYFTIGLILLIIVLVVLASIYDSLEKDEKAKKDNLFAELFTSFSATKNFLQLFSFSPQNDYGLLHFLKVTLMIMVIYGHRRIYSLGYPSYDLERTETIFKGNFSFWETTHLTVVDVFFMMTGFLTYHFDFSPMSKHGSRFWFVAIVHRWMRLIPVFVVLLLFFIFVFPYIGDGPLWNAHIAYEVNNCRSSWWAIILGISNIVNTDKQCLILSWYISADLQLALIGLTLLYLHTRSRIVGWICITLTFVAGMVITFLVAFFYQHQAILPTYINFHQDPYKSEEFTKFYITTYTRIAPYILGLVTALLIRRLNEKKFAFSAKQITFGLLLTLILGEGYQHVAFFVYEFDRPYNALEHAFYASTYRLMYALPFAFMICTYFTSREEPRTKSGEILHKFLELKTHAIFGRLTYSQFLIHSFLQIYHAASQPTWIASSLKMNRAWWVCGDVILSYTFAFILYIFLEAPVANTSKIMRREWLKRSQKSHKISKGKESQQNEMNQMPREKYLKKNIFGT